MKLIDELRSEHRLIERVVGALQTYAAERAAGRADDRDLAGFLAFFRLFADRFHHAREEGVLFPALVATEVPADRGPLQVLAEDHARMRLLVAEIASCAPGDLPRAAASYGEALLHHIDAEESVLFPEAALRFQRVSTLDLESRAPEGDEEAARAEGLRLTATWIPREIPGIFRGDGCVCCPAYGSTCDGIEREWWSELEWEDTLDRMADG